MNDLHEMFGRVSARFWPVLGDHALQAALFVIAVLALTALLGRARARVRYALWMVAAAKFLLPASLFAVGAAWLNLRFPSLAGGGPETGAALALFFAEPLSSALEVTVRAEAAHAEIYCALSLAWFGGCVLSAAVFMLRRRAARLDLSLGREVWSGREFEIAERARERLGLNREVRLVLTPGRGGPGLWHARRPTIVLPDEVSARLDDAELEAVMLHELAHAERRDNLAGLFQAALCCLFWFHPLVWLVNRRLLEERERACDERVLEAGGEPGSYASGILKVVRLGLGWEVAGVSGAAAGTNLKRRIEMIMSGEKARPAARWQRALPAATAAAALCLTLGPALFGGEGTVAAQSRGGSQTSSSGVQKGEAPTTAQKEAVREIMQLPEVTIAFENAPNAPVVFTDARVRVITSEQYSRAEGEIEDFVGDLDEAGGFYATTPTVTLLNVSGKRIKELGFGFVKPDGSLPVTTGYAVSLSPGETRTFLTEWGRRNVILPGGATEHRLKLVWAVFEDGTSWGRRPAPPPAPPRPPAPPQPPDPGTGRATARATPENPSAPDAAGGSSGSGGQVYGGTLNGKVVSKPAPVYPPTAMAARAQGVVKVEIVVGEDGQVVSAEATSGHPLLRAAAAEAALAARFSPTLLEGKPVKVAGAITYNFVLSDDEGEGAQP